MIRKEDMDPVFYCRRCCSLGIKTVAGIDCCSECGSTDIGELPDIYTWEAMYIRKYGEPYVEHQGTILRGDNQ